MRIDREDMLELTRRMTLKRNCFTRLAGCYMDSQGENIGSFNTHFLDLTLSEREENLKIAKAIPFSETNVKLKGYAFEKEQMGKGSIWQLITGLNACGLKNDALVEIFCESVAKEYKTSRDYGIIVFHGCYDVPIKAKDKAMLDESEEVYNFLVGAICPANKEYELGSPEWGFLFPAFVDRSSDCTHIAVFEKDVNDPHKELLSFFGCY